MLVAAPAHQSQEATPVHRLGTPSFADWFCEWRSTRVLGVASVGPGPLGVDTLRKYLPDPANFRALRPAHLAPDRVSPGSQKLRAACSAISRVRDDFCKDGFPFGAPWIVSLTAFGKSRTIAYAQCMRLATLTCTLETLMGAAGGGSRIAEGGFASSSTLPTSSMIGRVHHGP